MFIDIWNNFWGFGHAYWIWFSYSIFSRLILFEIISSCFWNESEYMNLVGQPEWMNEWFFWSELKLCIYDLELVFLLICFDAKFVNWDEFLFFFGCFIWLHLKPKLFFRIDWKKNYCYTQNKNDVLSICWTKFSLLKWGFFKENELTHILV